MTRIHLLAMVLCCLAVLAAFVAVQFLRVPLATVVIAAAVILCPLTHALMMASGHRAHQPK